MAIILIKILSVLNVIKNVSLVMDMNHALVVIVKLIDIYFKRCVYVNKAILKVWMV